MRIIKSILIAFLVTSTIALGIAQINIVDEIVNQNSIPLINRSKPLRVDVKWDMDGKSQTFLNESLNYLDEGSFNLALSNIDSFVTRNTKLWAGHYYRGQILMRMGRFIEAQAEFTSTTLINPSLVEAHIELSEAFEFQRKFTKAEESLKKATELNPKYVYAYYKLGNLALQQRDVEQARTYYKKCNKIDPKFPDSYMAMGIISMRQKPKEAISFFDQSLQADSTFSSAYFWRGIVHLDQNKKPDCLKDWDQFIELNPRNHFAKTMRGYLNTELGNYEEAFSDFRKVLQTVDINEDKFQGAQTPLDKRIDLQVGVNYLVRKGYGLPEATFTNLKAAVCLMLMNDDKRAIEFLKKAERASSSAAIYFLTAIAFEHAGAHDAAFRYYGKTLEYDNDIFDAHKKRSVYLSELKKWKLAYQDIDEMFRIQPASPVAYRLRGLMNANQHRYTEAINDLTRFISTDSTDIEALRNRAFCLSFNHYTAEATKDFDRILKLDESQQLREEFIEQLLSIGDTVNGVFLLKEYLIRYRAIGALVELSKILIAQKKYDEVAQEIANARAEIKQSQNKNFLVGVGTIKIIANNSLVRSDLFMLEGMLSYHREEYEDAVQYFTNSLKENSQNLESKYLRGKCFIRLLDFKNAKDDFKSLMDKNYKDSNALYNSAAKGS